MGGELKELGLDVVTWVVQDLLDRKHSDDVEKVGLPTTYEIVQEYNGRTGESVHSATMKGYLNRKQVFVQFQVSQRRGWITRDELRSLQ